MVVSTAAAATYTNVGASTCSEKVTYIYWPFVYISNRNLASFLTDGQREITYKLMQPNVLVTLPQFSLLSVLNYVIENLQGLKITHCFYIEQTTVSMASWLNLVTISTCSFTIRNIPNAIPFISY